MKGGGDWVAGQVKGEGDGGEIGWRRRKKREVKERKEVDGGKIQEFVGGVSALRLYRNIDQFENLLFYAEERLPGIILLISQVNVHLTRTRTHTYITIHIYTNTHTKKIHTETYTNTHTHTYFQLLSYFPILGCSLWKTMHGKNNYLDEVLV